MNDRVRVNLSTSEGNLVLQLPPRSKDTIDQVIVLETQ